MEASSASVDLPLTSPGGASTYESELHNVGMHLSGPVEPGAGNSFLILSKGSQKALRYLRSSSTKPTKCSFPLEGCSSLPILPTPPAWVPSPWTTLTLALFWDHGLFINHRWANSCYRGVLRGLNKPYQCALVPGRMKTDTQTRGTVWTASGTHWR